MNLHTRKNVTKVLASVVLVGGAASVAGLGTFGSFTDTTTASQAVSTGIVDIDLTQHATRGLDVAATNLVPGDTIQRAVRLTRSSTTEKFGTVTLSTSGATANLLTTDTANGLKVKVDQCSVPWTPGRHQRADLHGRHGDRRRPAARARHQPRPRRRDLHAELHRAASNLRVELVLPSAAGNCSRACPTPSPSRSTPRSGRRPSSSPQTPVWPLDPSRRPHGLHVSSTQPTDQEPSMANAVTERRSASRRGRPCGRLRRSRRTPPARPSPDPAGP